MTLEIISAEEMLFTGEVSVVTIPGAKGEFTVLRNHAPLVSILTAGNITYRDEQGKDGSTSVGGGVVVVKNNVITVCIYSSES